MPSQTFLLSRPASNALESLPVYTRTSPSTSGYHYDDRSATCLPTILEMAEEDCDEDDEALYSTRPPAAYFSSWDLARLLRIEYASMMPQAVLVDASATLCAYLYFTSLQARLALQGQASLNLLSSVCNSMPVDADPSVVQICSKAMANAHAALANTLEPTETSLILLLSHHVVIAMVLLKAVFGYSVMRLAARFVRPFDYLVASGAAHCLLLYFAFFVPVADALNGSTTAGSEMWLRVMTKFFWLLIACSAIGLVHWIATSGLRASSNGSIELVEEEQCEKVQQSTSDRDEEYYYGDEKDAVLLG